MPSDALAPGRYCGCGRDRHGLYEENASAMTSRCQRRACSHTIPRAYVSSRHEATSCAITDSNHDPRYAWAR
jgi:hypothetical protein